MNQFTSAKKVLVLDGAQRSALAATRSLGRAGHEVIVGDESSGSLAAASRHCRGEIVYPSPYSAPNDFMSWFEAIARRERFFAVLPMTEVTTDLVLRHRGRWPQVPLPYAPIDVIDSLSDKVQLYRRAIALNVPVPESVVVDGPSALEEAMDKIGFPAILKPRRSRFWTGTGFRGTSVRRVENRVELDAMRSLPEFSEETFLYQRIVRGEGRGLFALYVDGQAVAFFQHRRLREKPPQGGVSVLSESRTLDQNLLGHAVRLLDDVRWHGPAMVEFKGSDADGSYLMEINARFWGSLQLAIDAGVDFPRLLVDGAAGHALRPGDYRAGVRLRWLLGDLDRLYLVFKDAVRRGQLSDALKEMCRFMWPDFGRTRHEVFRWSDPQPALRELAAYVKATVTREGPG